MHTTSRNRIKTAKTAYLKWQYPQWNDTEISNFAYYLKKDNCANGLTGCILDFLKYEHCQAERINTMGKLVDSRQTVTDVVGLNKQIGSIKWQKGTGTNGSADISATIPINMFGVMVGVSVKIEVKFGKDRQSEDQKKYEQSINAAGGVYIIARTFDDFLVWYDNFKINGVGSLNKA